MAKNEGKKFEEAWQKSVPNHCYIKRLNDNAAGFSGGKNLRFTSTNECDFIMYDYTARTMYALELKSTKNNNLTFWNKDFEETGKKNTFMIKKNQILGLNKIAQYHIVSGFVINFRDTTNHTYFISIQEFLRYTCELDKRSINENDVLNMNPVLIEQKLLKVNYKYNIAKFLIDLLH